MLVEASFFVAGGSGCDTTARGEAGLLGEKRGCTIGQGVRSDYREPKGDELIEPGALFGGCQTKGTDEIAQVPLLRTYNTPTLPAACYPIPL